MHDPVRGFLFGHWKRSTKNPPKRLLQRRVYALPKHPALLCFILALVGSVYSGDVYLPNFNLKKKKMFLKPQGIVISLNIFFFKFNDYVSILIL